MVPAPPRPHRAACEARPAQGRVLRVLHPYGFRETQHWSVGHFSLVSATRTNSVCDRPLSRIGPVHTLRTRCALSVVHVARRFRWGTIIINYTSLLPLLFNQACCSSCRPAVGPHTLAA